jgi:hypothetical protein
MTWVISGLMFLSVSELVYDRYGTSENKKKSRFPVWGSTIGIELELMKRKLDTASGSKE